jgi:hypothetical protein
MPASEARGRPFRLLLVGGVMLAAPVALSTSVASAAETPYSLRATVACLHQRGGVVGPVRPTNRRLRALRDLAQKASVQVQMHGAVIGVAFRASAADASFLHEILQVPNDPLRLEQRRNVVLLAPKNAPAARSAVIGCLRT